MNTTTATKTPVAQATTSYVDFEKGILYVTVIVTLPDGRESTTVAEFEYRG